MRINSLYLVLLLAVLIGLYFLIAGIVRLFCFLSAAAFSWLIVNYIWMGITFLGVIIYIVLNRGLD